MKTTPMAFAVMAVAAGLFGVNSVGAFDAQTELTDMEILAENSAFAGHVTAIHKDASGNILSYLQSDNVVTDEGTDCASEILFAAAALSNNNCPIVWSGGAAEDVLFDAIQLYDEGTPTVASTAATPIVTPVTALGLTIVNGTWAGTTAATGGAATTITLTHQFTAGAGVSGEGVTGAILKLDDDSPDGTAIFAATAFSGGPVSMDDSDTLDVTWTMNLT